MKIVVDEHIPYLKGVLEPYATVVYRKGKEISQEDVRDASALIVRTRTRCDASLLEGSSVGLIATATIGMDHIDVDYCGFRGVTVANAAGCNAGGVKQYIGAVLAAWDSPEAPLAGKTLGVIGLGNVGSRVAALGRGFGMQVLCCDPPKAAQDPAGEYVSLDFLLRNADVVTMHVPLNRSGHYRTENLANSTFFSALKSGAYFINSSRGEVVDETALKAALRGARLGRCALDVWRGEPVIDPQLVALTSLATPHIAGYSLQGKAMGTALAVRAAARYFKWPLENWYPPGIPSPAAARTLSLSELKSTIGNYYNLAADDCSLRRNLDRFEELRNNYSYREEYF